MRDNVAIIGANDSILPLILKAKQKGYETHVFAWKTGAKGEAEADCFYPISISEKDKILNECRRIGICAVASITSDFAVPTVNYVARNLGLVGNSERCDLVARDKYQMRKAFKEAGLYTPRFELVDQRFNTNSINEFKFPLIVKPTDRWSSKGVTRVDRPEDLAGAIANASNESYSKKAIVEEFMDGPEYSAECICYAGEYWILAYTKKLTTGYPNYIETGHIQPSDLSKDVRAKAESTIKRALVALDIVNGAAHAEFRVLNDGNIGIIEIGARMGGDCIGTDLTPISTGMDYVGMVLDIACGKHPDFTVLTKPSPVKISYIINENDYNEYQKHKTAGDILRDGELNLDFTNEVVDSSTRHGFYIVKGD